MNLIDKVLRTFGYMKASSYSGIINAGVTSSMYGKSTPENYARLLESYNVEVWVYACTYVIATTLAELPWRLYKEVLRNGVLEKEYTFNPEIHALFKKPNSNDPNSTWNNLIEWTLASEELTGNAYWLLDKMVGTKPGAIQLLLSSRMRVKPSTSTDNFIDGYAYIKNVGEPQSFKPEEIRHFKYVKPDDYYYGQGSLSPCSYSVELIRESLKTNYNIFKNGALLDGAFETDQNIDEAKYKRMREQIKEKYTGSENAHTQMILDQGLKYHTIVPTMRDLEFIEGTKLSREDICAAFGVPPVIVGILDHATYSNYAEAEKILWKNTLLPKRTKLQQVISTVVQLFDKNLNFEFDISGVEALKDNEDQKSQIVRRYWDMGVPLNDLITAFKLPFKPVKGGEIGYLPFSVSPIGMAGASRQSPVVPPAKPIEEEEEGKQLTIKKDNQERKMALWKSFDALTNHIEKSYVTAISAFFDALEAKVVHKLTTKKDFTKDIQQFLFDKDKEIEDWIKVSSKYHKIAMKANGDRELGNLGVPGVSFDLSNPKVVKWLEQYGLEMAKSVIGTAREKTRITLEEGIANGESIDDLRKRINDIFTEYKIDGYSAEAIARTETISASNAGALNAYKQSGLNLKKGWLSQNDGRARDTHIEAEKRYDESGAIDMDANFHVGDAEGQYPGELSTPEESINCRCSIFAVRGD